MVVLDNKTLICLRDRNRILLPCSGDLISGSSVIKLGPGSCIVVLDDRNLICLRDGDKMFLLCSGDSVYALGISSNQVIGCLVMF